MDYQESLINKIEKNFKTTFVGAIDAFEKALVDELGDNDIKKKFLAARDKVLDIGNKQMRRSKAMLNRSNITKKVEIQNFRVLDNGNRLVDFLEPIGGDDDRSSGD